MRNAGNNKNTRLNADIMREVSQNDQSPITIHPLHQQWNQQQSRHNESSKFATPQMAADFKLTDGVNSTLNMPTSTIKTADINLDHDIAGEFEAAIDHSKLESRKKYDFMNLQGNVSQGGGFGASDGMNNSPFNAEGQSVIRPHGGAGPNEHRMRNTGSIMGDIESRDSSFITANHGQGY